MGKDIDKMTPRQIQEYLIASEKQKLLELKRKWKAEAEAAGVQFGAVMLAVEK